ncbi:uncharacterized protein BDFB_008841 [Asbolus verrucosus]|uniref:Uncharacterized protein n=1 Tax=Asbolus verrucosus TaxID=1661398 RepID=A0A482VB87_ASBVE|nr:uncharacterized protein BDFB_008841 [Asbolus verrucosus]
MLSKVVVVCFISLFIQEINCITRAEVNLQYSPTLQRLRTLSSTKYQEASREYTTLTNQLANQQQRTKNATQTQINNIKTIIANAKKASNVTTTVLNCLRVQENIAARLTTTSMNNCYTSANTSALVNNKARFNTLATVAANTVNWCNSLNPLETQLESYARCLADKIPDLNRQINIVENEYQSMSSATLNYNVKCLTDNAGAVLGQIGVISYEINICFFTPL